MKYSEHNSIKSSHQPAEHKSAEHKPADICLIMEGTYPYVFGGVSAWTHDMIRNHPDFTFHVITILPRDEVPQLRYELPKNISGLSQLFLQRLPTGKKMNSEAAAALFKSLQQPLMALTSSGASLADYSAMLSAVAPYRDLLGSKMMLDSEQAWELLTNMYKTSFPNSSMLDYFWSWRSIMGNLYSLMIAELPPARCYHALSTGYAGLMSARTRIETGRPSIITEHGIYTNERRIEIALADWLDDAGSKAMTIDFSERDLHDLWIDIFTNYSRISYEAADHIITLYGDNQKAQLADGANPEKMKVIPNGIDIERFSRIPRRNFLSADSSSATKISATEISAAKISATEMRPTIGLICRVVPIKDIKNFLTAVASIIKTIPNLRALIIGSSDEDPAYAEECRNMARFFALDNNIIFTGQVKIEDYLPEIDILVSCSISEAQPLVILEAGAAGIPAVVTDVGSCRELLMGSVNEAPNLGPGGVVVPPSNSSALASGVLKLFADRELYQSCCASMRARVARYYKKQDQYGAYHDLYSSCIK